MAHKAHKNKFKHQKNSSKCHFNNFLSTQNIMQKIKLIQSEIIKAAENENRKQFIKKIREGSLVFNKFEGWFEVVQKKVNYSVIQTISTLDWIGDEIMEFRALPRNKRTKNFIFISNTEVESILQKVYGKRTMNFFRKVEIGDVMIQSKKSYCVIKKSFNSFAYKILDTQENKCYWITMESFHPREQMDGKIVLIKGGKYCG